MLDGEEQRCLEQLLRIPQVAMVGINWRTFGSSGHKTQTDEPVIVRFTEYCTTSSKIINNHLKSVTKIACATKITPHISFLCEGYRQVDVQGEDICDYVSIDEGEIIASNNSGVTRSVTEGPLRVNHYVIKSEQEFLEKKTPRGDASAGVRHVRHANYFSSHDFKDAKFIFPAIKINRLRLEIDYLKSLLESTTFVRSINGSVDLSKADSVLTGWVVDDFKSSAGISVNIFVNGVWEARVSCGFYRPDLKRLNISLDGMSGFRYTHPKPLLSGDVVDVKVHASRYPFPGGGRTVII
jgi:hypothetical protein